MATSLNKHVNRVCHQLRVSTIRSLNHKWKKFPELYVLFRKHIPTDPLCLETSCFSRNDNGPNVGKRISSSGFIWSSFVAFFISISLNAGIYTLYAREACRTELGLLFIVPYTLVWIICAKPFLELEIAQGQMAQSGPVNTFVTLHSRVSGMGFAMMTFLLLSSPGELYYSGKLLWYTFSSLSSLLPWEPDITVIQRCASITSPQLCSASNSCLYRTESPICVPSIMKLVMSSQTLEFYLETIMSIEGGEVLYFFNRKLFSCMILSCLATLLIAYSKLTFTEPLSRFSSISSIIIYTVLAVTFLVENDSKAVSVSDFINKKKWTKLMTDASPWLSAFIVVISSNDIIRGAYYALGSFTTRGTPVLHGSLVSLSVQLYVGTITTLVLANYNEGLSELILNPKKTVYSIFFTQAEIFPFILFPVCVLYLPGPPFFAIIIFLFLWVQSLLKLALIFTILSNILRDSLMFSTFSEFWHNFLPFIVILVFSFPYVINLSIYNLGGMRAIIVDYILEKIVAPFLGIGQILMFETVYGWKERQCILSNSANYIRPVIFILHIVVLSLWAAHFYHTLTHWILKLFLGSLTFFISSTFLLSLYSKETKPSTFMMRFISWTLGGVERLRMDINHHIQGVFQPFRSLSFFWSLSFGLLCPFMLLLGLFHNMRILYSYGLLMETYPVTLTLAVIFCSVASPILIGLIYPKIFFPLYPIHERQYTYEKAMIKYCTPQFAMRRIPYKLFEEFRSIKAIWKRAYALDFQKIY